MPSASRSTPPWRRGTRNASSFEGERASEDPRGCVVPAAAEGDVQAEDVVGTTGPSGLNDLVLEREEEGDVRPDGNPRDGVKVHAASGLDLPDPAPVGGAGMADEGEPGKRTEADQQRNAERRIEVGGSPFPIASRPKIDTSQDRARIPPSSACAESSS